MIKNHVNHSLLPLEKLYKQETPPEVMKKAPKTETKGQGLGSTK